MSTYELSLYVLKFFVLVVSLTFHEAAHAWAAYRLGDETSARLGRMSLNPLVHLDPVGTLMFLFPAPLGWAKPVPVNPSNLKNPHAMMQLISFAGPLSNLTLAIAGCLIYYIIGYNFDHLSNAHLLLQLFIATNISLAIFNLLPVFPLDGANVITVFMSEETARRYEDKISQFGPFPLLLVVMFETLPGMGLIEVWFRFWRPIFAPILEIFRVPTGIVHYW